MTNTIFHRKWWSMIARCDYKCSGSYENYGGRGISYDPRWRTFTEFYKDMWPSYVPGLSLDRIDPNGNYCKENCRWIPLKEQAGNKRNSRFVEWNGQKLTCSAWARENGLHRDTVLYRLKHGWTPEEILNTRPCHSNRSKSSARVPASSIPCTICGRPSRCNGLCSSHYGKKMRPRKSGPRNDNTSGVTGVCWNVESKKWIARIGTNGERKYLGRFSTLDEAKAAYSLAKSRLLATSL